MSSWLLNFNSTLVRLKLKEAPSFLRDTFLFQFYISAIKTGARLCWNYR